MAGKEEYYGTAEVPDTRRRPIIDLEARREDGPVTPVDVHVTAIQPLPGEHAAQDPTTYTGSLPVLAGVVAAIEEGKKMHRTPAEARHEDLMEQFQQVEAWWRGTTEADISDTLPKALEYGSGDLDLMGQAMLMMQGDVWDGGDDAEKRAIGQELAILFYIQGKVSRALSAAKDGKRCSGDTIKDVRVYAVMLQRVRDTGRWIG